MKVIVGLGNPGKKYEHTRHNIGFAALDACAEAWDISIKQEKFQSFYGEGRIDGERVLLLKPLTYMNLSGEAVRPFLDFYKLTSEQMLVIYDDLDLSPGAMRLRKQGGAGGHNGVKSLIAHVGTKEFNRIRLGIGRPQHQESVADYVLSRFREEEAPLMADVLEKTVAAASMWITNPFLAVMNKFN